MSDDPMRKGYVVLKDRAWLRIGGPDAVHFLQGLITQDTTKLEGNTTLYGCLLNPQGKFQHDFFMSQTGAGDDAVILLDTEADRAPALLKRLTLFRLRSKVTLELVESGLSHIAVIDDEADPAGLAAATNALAAYRDPRLPQFATHLIVHDEEAGRAGLEAAHSYEALPISAYETRRLGFGLPKAGEDMPIDDATLLECNIDLLNGIDWQKGCYMGQEVTARMHYRGLLKKRLTPLTVSGPLPYAGTDVTLEGRVVGDTRSAFGAHVMALLRLDALQKAMAGDAALKAGDATLTPATPDWLAHSVAPKEAADQTG